MVLGGGENGKFKVGRKYLGGFWKEGGFKGEWREFGNLEC